LEDKNLEIIDWLLDQKADSKMDFLDRAERYFYQLWSAYKESAESIFQEITNDYHKGRKPSPTKKGEWRLRKQQEQALLELVDVCRKAKNTLRLKLHAQRLEPLDTKKLKKLVRQASREEKSFDRSMREALIQGRADLMTTNDIAIGLLSLSEEIEEMIEPIDEQLNELFQHEFLGSLEELSPVLDFEKIKRKMIEIEGKSN
jgi:protease II